MELTPVVIADATQTIRYHLVLPGSRSHNGAYLTVSVPTPSGSATDQIKRSKLRSTPDYRQYNQHDIREQINNLDQSQRHSHNSPRSEKALHPFH